MGKTEKIGDLAEEAAEALADRRKGGLGRRIQRWAWQNAFPTLCGLIVMGAATFVTDLWDDYAETKAEFVDFQMDTDYKFRQAEDAIRTLAAENIALRKLLERQQVEVGLTAYKVGWLHPPKAGAGQGPSPEGPPTPAMPGAAGLDYEKIVRLLEERLGARAKVTQDDLDRILAKKGNLYEQRQMPKMPPAGGR